MKSIHFILFALGVLTLGACSTNQLEARLQADPQCKPVVNPKTGALMPCPGSDKAFYKSIAALSTGTETSAPTDAVALSSPSASARSQGTQTKPAIPSKGIAPVPDCKPVLHQKSGALMPCPAP